MGLFFGPVPPWQGNGGIGDKRDQGADHAARLHIITSIIKVPYTSDTEASSLLTMATAALRGGCGGEDKDDQARYEISGSPRLAVRDVHFYLLGVWSIIGDEMGIMNPMWHGEISEQLSIADIELLARRFQHQDEDQTCDDDELNGGERPVLRVAPASQQQAAAW